MRSVRVTVKKSIHSTGSRLEPGIDNVVEWSSLKEGELKFSSEDTTFGDWVIPNAQVTDAILNNQRYFFGKHQSLIINCDETEYNFVFHNRVESDFKFPFKVRATERKSLLWYLMVITISVILLDLLWNLVK